MKSARVQFTDELVALCDAYGKNFNAAQADRWWLDLASYRIDDVVRALRSLARTSPSFPSLSKVILQIENNTSAPRSCPVCHGTGTTTVRGEEAARGRRVYRTPDPPWVGADGLPKLLVECVCVRGRMPEPEVIRPEAVREVIPADPELRDSGLWENLPHYSESF
jgi:hypothetical protein